MCAEYAKCLPHSQTQDMEVTVNTSRKDKYPAGHFCLQRKQEVGSKWAKIKSSMFRAVRDKRLGSCLGTTTETLSLLSRALIQCCFGGSSMQRGECLYDAFF